MSSNQLVLQLTYALLAFAAVSGSPSRSHKGKAWNDGNLKGASDSFDVMAQCAIALIPDDISFVVFSKKYRDGNVLPLDGSKVPDLLKSTYTKIVTHGMRSNLSSPEMQELLEAYMDSEKDINIIGLDWSSRTRGMYRKAAEETVRIRKMVADSLICYRYEYYDIYPYQIHFIGHGLGAHLFGAAARDSRARIGRVTGLDPARLCFEYSCFGIIFPELTKNDAAFVDILHTDAGNMGILYSHGTADVYANYNKNQLRCHKPHEIPSPYCNSLSAISYFTTSVRNPFKYFAATCSSAYPDFKCTTEFNHLWSDHMENSSRGVFNFIPDASNFKN